MKQIVISGAGFYAPEDVISNEELVDVFNQYAKQHNLSESSSEFILKASGIKKRHVVDKQNILDINIMASQPNHIQAELALKAAKIALEKAHKDPKDIDAVICSSTNQDRPYPCIAIEIQKILGIPGFGFDMRAACSSATFGIQNAYNLIQAGNAKSVLVLTPEVCTPQVNFRDRDSHFIFGDAAVASIVELKECSNSKENFEIISTKLYTQYSDNIKSNPDGRFTQQGRIVFKEIVLLIPEFIKSHLGENHLSPENIKRYWLHQANINMNKLIIEKILGREATQTESPIILDEYANTAGAGSMIAFCLYHQDFKSGELGVLSSFGAGYSAGSIILRRV